VLNKVILPALLSPVVAALIALTVTYLALRVIARAEPGLARRGFKRGQTVSSSMLALAHGTNDAQKTMGVITLTLISSGMLAPGSGPPFWVVLSAGLAIALGTYMGGWRIIRTLGRRVSDIQPVQGFAAETTSAAVILTSTHLGLPLSTTQVCTGSIFGAGAGRRLAAVHWGMAGRIVLAWSFTLPAAAVVGAAASWLAATGTVGVIIVALTGIAVAAGIYAASRRSVVNALNVNDIPPPTTADIAA
jgi:PiT family inorganic phosphate transporter